MQFRYFQEYITTSTVREVRKFIDQNFGFPIIDGENWRGKEFSKSKFIEKNPQYLSDILDLGLYSNNKNSSYDFKVEIYLFPIHLYTSNYSNSYTKKQESDFEAIFSFLLNFFHIEYDTNKKLSFEKSMENIIKTFNEIRKMQYDIDGEEEQKYTIIKLAKLQEIVDRNLKDFKIDIKSFFEGLLIIDSLSETTRIKLQLNVFLKSLQILQDKFNDEDFLNLFYFDLFLSLRETLSLYPVLDFNLRIRPTVTRNRQRYEQCIDLIEKQFPFILPRFIDKLVDEKNLNEVLKTFERMKIVAKDLIMKEELIKAPKKNFIMKKLDSMTLVTEFHLNPEDSKQIEQFSEKMISNQNQSLFEIVFNGKLLRKRFENTFTYSTDVLQVKWFPTCKFGFQ